MTDNYKGVGGSYKVDKDGNKVLIARTGVEVEQKPSAGYIKSKKDNTTPKEG